MKVGHAPEETIALLAAVGLSIEEFKVIRSIAVSFLISSVAITTLVVSGQSVPSNQVFVITISAILGVSGVELVELPILQALAKSKEDDDDE